MGGLKKLKISPPALPQNGKSVDLCLIGSPPSGMEKHCHFGVIHIKRVQFLSSDFNWNPPNNQWEFFTFVHAGRVAVSSSVPAAAHPSISTKTSDNKDLWAKYTGKDTKGEPKSAKYLSLSLCQDEHRHEYVYRCCQHVLDKNGNHLLSSNYSQM